MLLTQGNQGVVIARRGDYTLGIIHWAEFSLDGPRFAYSSRWQVKSEIVQLCFSRSCPNRTWGFWGETLEVSGHCCGKDVRWTDLQAMQQFKTDAASTATVTLCQTWCLRRYSQVGFTSRTVRWMRCRRYLPLLETSWFSPLSVAWRPFGSHPSFFSTTFLWPTFASAWLPSPSTRRFLLWELARLLVTTACCWSRFFSSHLCLVVRRCSSWPP